MKLRLAKKISRVASPRLLAVCVCLDAAIENKKRGSSFAAMCLGYTRPQIEAAHRRMDRRRNRQ